MSYGFRRDGDWSEITLPDGRRIASVPHATGEYEQRARELGYAAGADMSLEHDRIHCELAAVFGATSPALSAVAAGAPVDAWTEEELVKLIAARLNDPAQDAAPGGGFIRALRDKLRE